MSKNVIQFDFCDFILPLNLPTVPGRTLAWQEGERAYTRQPYQSANAFSKLSHSFGRLFSKEEKTRSNKSPAEARILSRGGIRKKKVITNHDEALRTSGDSCQIPKTYKSVTCFSFNCVQIYFIFNCTENERTLTS
jgi:hypothetical protein